jgi:aspartate/tyrosine/aromatic aminotransferase
MSYITKFAETKKSNANALLIGNEASKAKEKNRDIINSTIGMLYDEDSNFYKFSSVEFSLNELSLKEKYAYSKTLGDKEFQESILKWVFMDHFNDFINENNIACAATPGGTGAISLSFANYLNAGDKILLPKNMWSNYIQMAHEKNIDYITYNLFNQNNEFDIKDFKEKIYKIKEEQKRIFIVINDPCQNPTGYSLSNNEWVSIIEILNEASKDKTPTILLLDSAYIDYDKRGFKESRNNLFLLNSLNDTVLTLIAFSGSKTLSLYGIRIGALIAISKDINQINDFNVSADYSARSVWSLSSTLGQNIIKLCFNKYKDLFIKEINEARDMLIKRGEKLTKNLDKYNIKYLPYSCGFFLTIPLNNPNLIYNKLKEKGLYILPLKDSIRITISSITQSEIDRLTSILNEVLNEVKQ